MKPWKVAAMIGVAWTALMAFVVLAVAAHENLMVVEHHKPIQVAWASGLSAVAELSILWFLLVAGSAAVAHCYPYSPEDDE